MASDTAALAERYRRFAAEEARGSSPLYVALANHVAESPALLEFLAGFPAEMQQPNLFLAAVRHVAGTPSGPAKLDDMVARHGPEIARTMRSRTTQTNEPGRCARCCRCWRRSPARSRCSRWGRRRGSACCTTSTATTTAGCEIDAPEETRDIAPILRCEASANTPLPRSLPAVAWRAGLDLAPAASRAPRTWRGWKPWSGRSRRTGAPGSARRSPWRGGSIPGSSAATSAPIWTALAGRAPADAKLVVFHTAVLAYVTSQDDRDAFARTCRELGATWICNEFPQVFPWIAAKARGPHRPGMFLMSVDGEPVAWTMPHGQRLEWL